MTAAESILPQHGRDKRQEQRRPTLRAHAAVLGIFALAGAVTPLLGLSRPDGIAVWPAAALGCGIGLGFLVRFGIAVWPTVLAGAAAANLMAAASATDALVVAVAQSGAVVAAGWMMRRMDFARDLCRLRDFLLLALWGPGFAALATALAAVAVLAPEVDPGAGLAARTWLACATGCLLVAPVLLIEDEGSPPIGRPAEWATLAGIALLTVATQLRALPDEIAVSLVSALIVFAVLAAMFHRARTVAAMVLVAGLVAIVGASLAVGPFDHPAEPRERVVILVQLCLLACGALGVCAIRAERQRLSERDSDRLRRIAASGRRYAHDDAETRIAGDLNQPLSAIRTYAQTASRVLAREDAAERRKLLERALNEIVSGTERAARVVRPARDGGHLPASDVESRLRRALREAGWEFASRGIRFSERIAADLPAARVPDDELERVVLLALHASIERALGCSRRRELTVDCAFDDQSSTIELEFRVRVANATDCADAADRFLQDEWLGGLPRFESRGGRIRTADPPGWHVITISLPAGDAP